MLSHLQPPLVPRNGHQVKVLGIARISTEHQNVLSLEDQEALLRRWLREHTDLPIDLHMIAGRGSGESLDRKEILEATAEVETGTYDLVIAEDLGRIFRRAHALLFCEACEDVGTRLVAINDHVDTCQDNWQVLAGFATLRHELHNADTAKRIRRTLRNRFQQGGVVQTMVFGYIKPPGTKTDQDLQKDPKAEAIYQEIFRRLESGASYSEVADWLNDQGVKPGPSVRSPRWTCQLLTLLVHNPILKGVRVRNQKMSKRVNQTGHRKSGKAPASERLERHCPHLAFIEPARYDRLIAMLDASNAKYKRKGCNGIDPRANVPKKRTVWPGQHLYCGICGQMYVYGGHGQKDHLMCRGAHAYSCWKGITADGPLAAEKLITAFRAQIAALPDFDPVLLDLVRQECLKAQDSRGQRQHELTQQLATNQRAIQHILAAIREDGHSSSLMDDLKRLEQQNTELQWQQQDLVRSSAGAPKLPTMAEIKALAFESMDKLAVTSPEFGRLLRLLIPRIVVWPYRLCDGGHPVLRAHFSFSLAPLLPEVPARGKLAGMMQRSLMVDLFVPPQREVYRWPVMELTSNGLTQRKIACELGLTLPAVQAAVVLTRRMEALEIDDPYIRLTGPMDDYDRMCRHKHPRYHFEPLSSESPPPDAAKN
jgi:DNA invertase Pin-like site-specific DNA recombinase